MKTVCQKDMCTGCGACLNACSHNAVKIVDDVKHMNAVIDEKSCINCGICEKVCPNNNAVQKQDAIFWKQGWAAQQNIRSRGSSGGIASALFEAFIKNGGVVCSCLFDKGEFKFLCTEDLEKVKRFAGSKYVKSNPGLIYKEVKQYLNQDRAVLFLGLPCQVAALLNFIPKNQQKKLYTIDLICHGTPSQKLLELYLKQNGVSLQEVDDIKFRSKGVMGLKVKGLSALGTVDRYLISFLNALNYTENCYHCQYATTERVSDLTLGDSWGTALVNEMENGVSLIGCYNKKGQEILDMAKITLNEVDIEEAKKYNGNLINPSIAPSSREEFFQQILKGRNYNKLIGKYFPRQCIRQNLKRLAIKLKLKKPQGGYRIVVIYDVFREV